MPAITQGHTVNNITKTVLFPVPETYLGDTQDDTEVGIATYIGPRYLRTRWERPDAEGNIQQDGSHGVWDWDDPSGQFPCPLNCVEVKLDAEQYPIHAIMLWGQAYPGEICHISCGTTDTPPTQMMDPLTITEALEPQSCKYDPATEAWSTPQFRRDAPDDRDPEAEGARFSWAITRQMRDHLLQMSDQKVAMPDVPDAVKQPWIEYRQKLRDLPTDWADVGNSTYLIQWPMEPDVAARGVIYGARPENGSTA